MGCKPLTLALAALVLVPAVAAQADCEGRLGSFRSTRIGDTLSVSLDTQRLVRPGVRGIVRSPSSLGGFTTSGTVRLVRVRGAVGDAVITARSSRAVTPGASVCFGSEEVRAALVLDTAPPGAAVIGQDAGGARLGTTPFQSALTPGQPVELRVEAAGASPQVVRLVGPNGGVLRERVELFAGPGFPALPPSTVPDAGRLRVTTVPAGGAVVVDGRPVEGAELALAPATYRVRAERDTLFSETVRVVIPPGGTVDLELPMQTAFATLHVESNVAGAMVSVDGVVVGPAPIALARRAGPAELTLSAPGYATVADRVEVPAAGDFWTAYALDPALGRLVIEAAPAALVTVGGRRLGEGSLAVLLPAGTYPVAAGGAPQTATVVAGDSVVVTFAGAVPPATADAGASRIPPPTPAAAVRQARFGQLAAPGAAPPSGGLDTPRPTSRALALAAGSRRRADALSPGDRARLDALHTRVRTARRTGDAAALLGAARELFALVPGDAATTAALRDGLRTQRAVGRELLAFELVPGRDVLPGYDASDPGVPQPPPASVLLGTTEVTNAQFVAFLNAVGTDRGDGADYLADGATAIVEADRRRWALAEAPGLGELPVREATWHGAAAFAAWIGGRLPSSAEHAWAEHLGRVGESATGAEAAAVAPSALAPDAYGFRGLRGNAAEWLDAPAPRADGEVEVVGSAQPRARIRADAPAGTVGFRVALPLVE